ncbi:hypothetical protein [Wolbachia endosymbiont of Pentidionis agamae]|uniref:hypothetical protein n=1 Tax=Wolbachia endosymbiont of Pentidionis agamae TaxID=3110435 RepID=UPI002FD25614
MEKTDNQKTLAKDIAGAKKMDNQQNKPILEDIVLTRPMNYDTIKTQYVKGDFLYSVLNKDIIPLINTKLLKSLNIELNSDRSNFEMLNTKVGDNDNGLVKDLNALTSTVGSNNSTLTGQLETLKSTVGDKNGGLVKSLADLKSAFDSGGTPETDPWAFL